jgi:thiamine biosynthesis lipoprotein
MGNTAIVDASSLDAFSYAKTRLWELEQAWSRFIPGSDISRLNARDASRLMVQRETAALLSYMREAHSATGGLFDPTMLRVMCEIGYKQSLSSDLTTSCPAAALDTGAIAGMLLEEVDGVWYAELPRGTVLDPGAVGKGLAADIVAEELARRAQDRVGVAVSIGGDVRVIGVTRSIGVEHPLSGAVFETIECQNGALATSSIYGKRLAGSRGHVIDPRTLQEPTHDFLQVTVAASTCVWAEALATACLVSGDFGPASRLEIGAIAVRRDGSVEKSPFWSPTA